MIHLRSHRAGITLLEVIFSLLMIGIVFSILFSAQGNGIRSGVKTRNELVIMRALSNRFVEIDQQEIWGVEKPVESPLPDDCPAGTVQFTAQVPAQKSGLLLAGLRIELVRATWHDGRRERVVELKRYRLYPKGVHEKK